MKNPVLALFLRLTAVVAIAILVLIVAAFVLKVVLIAAVVAAVAVGVFLLYNLIRRRSRLPVIR